MYLTIGNIPKAIRRKPTSRAQVLVAYIPTSKLEGITNKAARRRSLVNLYHACMRTLLAPIASYGETGIAMASGDGTWRRCHPIFSIFVGDYPEQTLVTCTYNGRCPKCTVPPDQLGEYYDFLPRNINKALDAYQLADADIHAFYAACQDVDIKPVYKPFWEPLPLVNVYMTITPDILHQLLQGVMKHLIKWLSNPAAFGPAQINARCRILPLNHNISLFLKGITFLSRVSGQEHKAICSIILGLIVGIMLPGGQSPSRILGATRALLDFLFLAQLPSHTTGTLLQLKESLSHFHDNKEVFIDLGIREQFNLPKLHSLQHYQSSIELFGTTDNYNTEQSERLHIDFAKDAYRATNRKDEYSQMTIWLERQEKIKQHTDLIERQKRATLGGGELAAHQTGPIGPPIPSARVIRTAQNPTFKAVPFEVIREHYGAIHFPAALADYLARINNSSYSGRRLNARARNTLIPFHSVPVFNKIKFSLIGNSRSNNSEIVDAVHARPEQVDTCGHPIPARFDTVLVRGGTQWTMNRNQSKSNCSRSKLDANCFSDYHVAQVRVVFQIPSKVHARVFPSPEAAQTASAHLAYIEWFSSIPATPHPVHRMYKVSRSMRDNSRSASIIPVDTIISSVHLFPHCGPVIPDDWTLFSVLEHCQSFYINPFSSRDVYLTLCT